LANLANRRFRGRWLRWRWSSQLAAVWLRVPQPNLIFHYFPIKRWRSENKMPPIQRFWVKLQGSQTSNVRPSARFLTRCPESIRTSNPSLLLLSSFLHWGQLLLPVANGCESEGDFCCQLKANPKAWKFFRELAPTHRRRFVIWIYTAKRPETREKRIRESIALLAARKKLCLEWGSHFDVRRYKEPSTSRKLLLACPKTSSAYWSL